MQIKTKRIYEPLGKDDGFRVFVDRLWPRGLKKEASYIELWFKIIAPSGDLRQWLEHDPSQWLEFKQRYFKELEPKKELITKLLLQGPHQIVTLLYAASNQEHNNAVALKEYLENIK